MASKSTFKSAQGGTLSSLGGPKATDFDAILLEGLQALAKRVQEHHEYLQAQHAPPHNGRGDPPTPSREPNRNFKLPVLEEEQEVGGADGPSPPGVAQTLCDIVPSSPAPSIKEDRPKPVKLNFDLHSRWKTLDALRSQDSSVAVAAALYQQDEGESIEGSDSEKSNCEDGRKPGTLQRCVKRVNTCMTPWMISPNSVVRSCWDSLACIFVIYECIMIPLAFFDFGESAFLDVVGWIVRIFWSVDFPLSFFTGYALPGEMVEMRPKKVFPHYAKTWMSLDVSMLCVDWAEVIIGGGGMGSLNAARMGKTVKSLRMIRMMRLWRLLNVNRLPESVKVLIHHYFQSEVSRIVLDICKILLFLVWINHVLACCWYGIADSMTLEDGSWLQKERFQDQEFAFLYMTCFHWSLTQFAGSTDVYPVSVYERTFAVCALVFCFIISASIVSSITTSMTRLSIARSKETTKLAALKEYLREHHISSRTALRVQRNAQYALEEQKRHTPEEDIELLAFLSEPLRVELRYEISMPALRRHGFFQTLDQENPAVARQMCYKALGSMMIHKAEILFVQGVEQVNQMYLFTDGKLSYFRDSSVGIHTKASSQRTNIVRKKDKITIGNGDWACDAALWTAWTTCGTVRAKTQCTVLTLTAEDFHNIVSQYKDVVPSLQSFGRRFVKYLNSKEPSDLTDLNDVECDLGEMAREAFRDLEQETHKPSGLSLKRGASLNNFFTRPVTSEERPKWLNSLMGRIERTRANRGGRTSSSGSSSTPTSARVAESKPDSESDPVVMH